MRKLILALTALTAMAAFTAVGVLVASTEPGAPADPTQKRQIHSGGLAGGSQGGFLRGGAYDAFAKGDMMGDGGGAKMGNMGGDMMGNMGKKDR
jgi:hypothetical protein